MKLLLLVPDDKQAMHMSLIFSNAIWSSKTCYSAILVRKSARDCYSGSDFVALDCADRGTCAVYETEPCCYSSNPFLKYEAAVDAIRSPLVGAPEFYWENIIEGIEKLQQQLDRSDADILVTWGERCWYNEVAISWANNKGIPCIRLERGCLHGTYIVDDLGLEFGRNRFYDVYNNIKYASVNESSKLRRVVDKNKTLEPQNNNGMRSWEIAELLDPHKKVVFVPLQVPIDTNVVFNGASNTKLLDFVSGYDEFSVVAKLHPADKWTNQEMLNKYCEERGIRILDAPLKNFLAASSAVITMNSQVAIDSLICHMKVGVIGNAFWKYTDATINDPKSPIDVLLAKSPRSQRIRRFLVALRLYYLCEAEQVPKRIEELVGVSN